MSQRSRALARIRLGLLYLFVAGLVATARPTPTLLAAGAGLILLGEAVRLWAAGHLVKSVRLVTSGPYAYTQNPLYLGRLLILTGLAIAAHNEAHLNLAALAAGYLIFFLYYLPRKIRVEGDRLSRLHGAAFDIYRRSVPVLIPTFKRFAGETSPWSLGRMVRNQEPLVIVGLLAALAFLCWRMLRA
ncbi:MAG: methyltransferase family protein [Acidobacteriota bacterium]